MLKYCLANGMKDIEDMELDDEIVDDVKHAKDFDKKIH